LRAFNLALLGKCKWTKTSGSEGLWYKELDNKYVVSEGMIKEDIRGSSSWGKDVSRVDKGVRDFQNQWFSSKFRKEIGNGMETSVWNNYWSDGGF